MRHLFLVVAAALSMLPRTVEAAGLGPSKASQLVTAYTSGPCPIAGNTGINSVRVSRMVASDGTTTDMVIPPKKVLVLTDVAATAGALSSGHTLLASVVVGSDSDGDAVAGRFETASSSGIANLTFTFPTGVAVRSGSAVCITMENLNVGGFVSHFGHVHGYFAPDK